MKTYLPDNAFGILYDTLAAGKTSASQGISYGNGKQIPAGNADAIKSIGGMPVVKEINSQLSSLVDTMDKLGIHTGRAGIAVKILGNNLTGLLSMNPYIWAATAVKGMLEYAAAINSATAASLSFENNKGKLWLKFGEMGITPIAKYTAERDELEKINKLGEFGSLNDVRQYVKDTIDKLSLNISNQTENGQPAGIYRVVEKLAQNNLGVEKGKLFVEKIAQGLADGEDHNTVARWAQEEFVAAVAQYRKGSGERGTGTPLRIDYGRGKWQYESGKEAIAMAEKRLADLGLDKEEIKKAATYSSNLTLSKFYDNRDPSWKLAETFGRLNVLRQMDELLDPKNTVSSVFSRLFEAEQNRNLAVAAENNNIKIQRASDLIPTQDNFGDMCSAMIGGNISHGGNQRNNNAVNDCSNPEEGESTSWGRQLALSREGVRLLKEVVSNTSLFSALTN